MPLSPVDAWNAKLFLNDVAQLGISYSKSLPIRILLEELLQICQRGHHSRKSALKAQPCLGFGFQGPLRGK